MTVVNENKVATKYEGSMTPAYLSILGLVGWLVFILLYAL
jgi:hypothetical protein